MTTADFRALVWRTTHEDPVIRPPALSPIVADPTFLLPHETPDGRWQLFAHTVWGVHRFGSDDGLRWRNEGLVVRHAMRPLLQRPRRRADAPRPRGDRVRRRRAVTVRVTQT